MGFVGLSLWINIRYQIPHCSLIPLMLTRRKTLLPFLFHFRRQIWARKKPKTRNKLRVGAGQVRVVVYRWSLASDWSCVTDPRPLIGCHWPAPPPGALTAPCVSRSPRGASCLQTTPARPAARTRPISSCPTPSSHRGLSSHFMLYFIFNNSNKPNMIFIASLLISHYHNTTGLEYSHHPGLQYFYEAKRQMFPVGDLVC